MTFEQALEFYLGSTDHIQRDCDKDHYEAFVVALMAGLIKQHHKSSEEITEKIKPHFVMAMQRWLHTKLMSEPGEDVVVDVEFTDTLVKMADLIARRGGRIKSLEKLLRLDDEQLKKNSELLRRAGEKITEQGELLETLQGTVH